MRKTNESESSLRHRETFNDVKTRDTSFSWDQFGEHLFIGQMTSGVKMA